MRVGAQYAQWWIGVSDINNQGEHVLWSLFPKMDKRKVSFLRGTLVALCGRMRCGGKHRKAVQVVDPMIMKGKAAKNNFESIDLRDESFLPLEGPAEKNMKGEGVNKYPRARKFYFEL